MEIEEGEYVRLRDGEISKIENIQENTFTCRFHKIRCELYIDFIVKHSKDIIDLIQEGDYINGLKVINEIYGEDDNNTYFELAVESNKTQYIGEKNIKSIVTKEQFSQMEYKLEE